MSRVSFLLFRERVLAHDRRLGFVGDTKHNNNIAVFWLRNKFGDDANVVEGTLSIRKAHGSIEDVDSTKLARMVPAILAAGKGMKIEVYPYAILTSPLDSFKEVPDSMVVERNQTAGDYDLLPAGFGEERLSFARLDSPVR